MTVKMRNKGLMLCMPATILLLIALTLFILLLNFDRIFLILVAKNLAISPTSPMFKNWLKPSVPIYFNVTLFNITNVDAILDGERPLLQEVGPFVYRETRERFDVEFGDNDTVKYKHRIFYHFDRNLSVDDPNNLEIYTPDLFFQALVAKNTFSYFGHGPFVKLTAEEVMWGYYPQALTKLAYFGLAPNEKVGLFAANNGTNVNEFVVNTGASNIQNIGRIYEVDGESMMSVWVHPEANMINGTDGSLAPPGLDVNSTVSFHVPDICRSSTMYAMERRRTVNRNDIEVVAFTGSPPNASSPVARWRTEMFCDPERGCPPKGLVELSPCIKKKKDVGLPFFLSMPYFLDGDPSLREPFDGLPVPNKSLHTTWVHIEPTTGAVLEAFKRIQFNVYIENTGSDSWFTSGPYYDMKGPYYFPIAWLSEIAVADQPALTLLSSKVFTPRQMLPFFIAIVSAVLFFIALILYLVLLICMRRSVRAGKRSNVVVPASVPASKGGDPLDEKLGPWTDLESGDHTRVPEARPLLQKHNTPISTDNTPTSVG